MAPPDNSFPGKGVLSEAGFDQPLLVARAFVVSWNKRAVLAIAAVGLSVAYAVLAAGASSGLRGASQTLSSDSLGQGNQVVPLAGASLAPVAVSQASAVVFEVREDTHWYGTIEPWNYDEVAVASSYHRDDPDARAAFVGLKLQRSTVVPYGRPDVVYVPPDAFHARFPDVGATRAYADAGADPGPGAQVLPASGAETFYQAGAGQIATGVVLVVFGSGAIVAVLSAGVIRLEVLAREKDLATLEALGGARQARRAVLGRVLFLVSLGAAIGTAAALVLLDLVSSSAGAQLTVSLGWVVLILAVTMVAGTGAGGTVGLRTLRSPLVHRLGRRGIETRRFPGPFRFLVVTPRVFAGVMGAALVTTAIFSVVLGAVAVPVRLFQPEDGTVLYGEVSGNPFRGTADRFLGEQAHRFEGVNASSPETYAPTFIEGRPLLVRGVSFPGWPSMTGSELRAGRWPEAIGEISLGARAARVLGAGLGSTFPAPTSYRPGLAILQVVGIHSHSGFSDDEALSTLDTAGFLAGIPTSQAHAVRVRTTDPDALQNLQRSLPLPVLAVRVVGAVVPLTQVAINIDVANFSPEESVRELTLHVNEEAVKRVVARLPPHSIQTVSTDVLVPDASSFRVQVNPEVTQPTEAAGLRVQAPARAEPNATVVVRVTTPAGEPVPDAQVRAGLYETRADAAGRAVLTTGAPGLLEVLAEGGTRRGGLLLRVAPGAWDNDSFVRVEDVFLTPKWDAAQGVLTLQAEVRLSNLGGKAFQGAVNWTLDNTSIPTAAFGLAPGARATISTNMGTGPGVHHLSVLGRLASISFQPPSEAGPPPPGQPAGSIGELIASRRSARVGTVTPEERTEAFLQDTIQGLETSTVLILIVTSLHTGGAVWVSVVREVRERKGVLATLEELGADRGTRMVYGVRDAALSVLPGLGAGIVGALLILALGQYFGFPAAFGHAIPIVVGVGFLARIATIFLIVGASAALYAVASSREETIRAVARRPLRQILQGGP